MSDAHIALIDDDENIATSLGIALENEGWRVSAYHDGEAGLIGITKSPPDLVVLDIKMPRMDGIEVLQSFRKFSTIPVILLTSKDDQIDEIIGLQVGADDYITKPFSQKLVITRIHALLRRTQLYSAPLDMSADKGDDYYHYGALTLDPQRYLCLWDETPLDLTVTEYLMISALARSPGHVKSRNQLIDDAYGAQIYVDERTIDSHIKRIRQKFKKADPDFDKVETVYGIGYRYKED